MDRPPLPRTGGLSRRELARRRALGQCYRHTLQSMAVGFGLAELILDPQGRPHDFRLLEVNEAFGHLTGFTPAQAQGRTACELAPDVEPHWLERFARVVLSGEPARFENYTAVLRKWLEVFAWRIAPLRFAFLFVDIGERKRAEQRSLGQSRLAEAVFTHSISPLVVLDRDYNFLRVNEAYASACRRDISEFAGRNHFEMYPSEIKRLFDDVVRTKQPFITFSHPFTFPDQPERGMTWWDWTLVPVLDQTGEIECLVFSLMDVTERKQADDALRESEARSRRQSEELALIYRTAPVGLCVLDPELRFVHINDRLAEANGMPVANHLGHTVREVVPDIARRIEPLLRRLLETGEPVLNLETVAETPAQPGVQRTWISQYWPLRGNGNGVVGINVVAEEITEQRHLEQAHRREQEFRTLAENSTDVVARFDRSLRRIYVNPAIEKILGRPREEIVGKSHREMGLPAELSDRLDAELTAVFSSGQPRTMETVVPTSTGERWLDSRLVPEFGPEGRVQTVLGITRDVTKRKQTELALQESEQRYRTLVENLYEGIWRIDETNTTTFVNARLTELLGYTREEMLGRELLAFMSEEAAATAKANLERGQTGIKADYEFEFRRKDGTPMLTRIATTPLFDDAGHYRGALAAVEDVTERKQAERELKRYAENQDFLANTALRLLEPMSRQSLFEYVTKRIHAVADGGIVLFSEFDFAHQRTILRTIGSSAEERETTARLFGQIPLGLTLDFPEPIRARMLPGSFERLSGGVCELAFFQLPAELCQALEQELQIRDVYAMACSVEQDLLGTVAVLTRGGLRQRRLIETLVGQAALALKRSRAEEALRNERNFFDTVVDTQGAVVAILDRQFRVLRLNKAYDRLTGSPADSMTGQDFRTLLDAAAAEPFARRVADLAQQDIGEFESLLRTREQGDRHVSWRVTARHDPAGALDYVIVTGIDITERKQMEERTRHLAEHDALTDLPNRRLLLELVGAALNSAQRSQRKVALLFLDLDRFKIINDTLGHEAGDALLRAVAQRLAGRVRRADIVSRLGGDEFTVLLGDLVRGEQAGEVAEELLRAFRPPFLLADQTLYVTTSIGISLYPDDCDDAEGLLRRADLAMYDAKDQGRNTYRFYNPAVDRRARERARIENSLRQALTGGELAVVYQPEIDLGSGRITGIEALVRWHHPELGLLHPDRFIPVAEESDLILALDDWVLHTACAQARQWLDQGHDPVCIGVNLSARRFESPDLVETVRRNLDHSGLPPQSLILELTEHTLMAHVEQGIERMRELVALGVCIAVDDFGTGYSSLSYLKRLPITTLKIDQSFVRDIATDADDRAIIQAVTALAHTLNKRVIAEGVETDAQRDFLRETGCDEAQGFLFARPLAATEVFR